MAVIEVKNLTKEYQLGALTNIKDSVANLFRRLRGKPVEERKRFKALDDINFSIEKGEVVGIIGTNGAGKSTLLKHLARITTPTSGSVNVNGAVAPLIEVGAGFVPDLTGRENIYLNCSIMGLSRKETTARINEIIEFSELEEFIDTPIKRYSSGMAVRLGFAVATSIDTDILIVDEVLAVGDLAFQRKCFDRMERLIKNSEKTVLIVGHNIRQLQRLCTRMLLLEKGQVTLDDEPTKVCNVFYSLSDKKIQKTKSLSSGNGYEMNETSGEITVLSISLNNDNDNKNMLELHEPLNIKVEFEAHNELVSPEIVIGFHTTDFVYIASASSATLGHKDNFSEGVHSIDCSIDDLMLRPGTYCLRVAFIDQYRRTMWYGENLSTFEVISTKYNIAKLPELGLIDIPFNWSFTPNIDHKEVP